MSTQNWIAVFKSEYFTTTAKFREYRKWIPIIFLGGIVVFSYILRALIDLLQANTEMTPPPMRQFFAIITVFSFFTLFAPLISPLGRVVYDNSSRSRREVALSSPVRPHELLYGNLLANLVFFLPFYLLVGTVSLSVFIGNGVFPPIVASAYTLISLMLIILMGLFGGTIVTPLVFNFIAKQRSDISRAIVTLFVAVLLMSTLPLLKYLLNSFDPNNLGSVEYLPFTLAATVIVYGLYGVQIGLPAIEAIVLLVFYNIAVIGIGYLFAEKLYSVEQESTTLQKTTGSNIGDKLLTIVAASIPNSQIRTMFKLLVKSAIRDIEQMSRLSIGIAATIFFLFALSSRGLFQGSTQFSGEIEQAIFLFSLILSASTAIYIEGASLTIQHKAMLTLIKAAPNGTRKFIIAKLLQMLFIQIPLFITLIITLRALNFGTNNNLLQITGELIIIIFALICIIIGIYMINPADNEEDLTNFINLLIFYVFSFAIAIYPVVQIITQSTTTTTLLYFFAVILIIAVIMVLIGIKALEQMDIETMSSDFSMKIHAGFKGYLLTLIAWNIVPLLAVIYLVNFQDLVGFTILATSLPLLIPIFYWKKHLLPSLSFTISNIKTNTRNLFVALGIQLLVSSALIFSTTNSVWTDRSTPLFSTNINPVFLLITVIYLVLMEEAFFRGFLQDYLSTSLSKNQAIIIQAIIFASFHFLSFVSFVNALVAGVLLGYLRVKSSSLTWPIIFHIINNSIIFGLLGMF